MEIVLIFIGFIILIIGMCIALGSIKPMYFNVFAGLIILLGTIFGLFGKQLQDKISSERTTEIIKTGEILKSKVDSQTQIIDKLRHENIDLYSKLASVSTEIYTRISGGDSYCVFEVFFDALTENPTFSLRHVGTTPLKNVQLTIDDLARRVFLNRSEVPSQSNDNTFYKFEYPSIYPDSIINKINISVENGQKDIRMRIWIQLDNGNLFETLEVNNFREVNRTYKLELIKDGVVLENKNHH